MFRMLIAPLLAALGVLLVTSGDAEARGGSRGGRLGFRAGNCGSGQRALFQGLRGRRHRGHADCGTAAVEPVPAPKPGKVPMKPAR